MELVLTFSNIFSVFIAIVLLTLIGWGIADFTKFIKERTRRNSPDIAEESLNSYDRTAKLVSLAATFVVLAGLVMVIAWNVTQRKEALLDEAAFVAFTSVLVDHTKTEFDQLCTFNGFLAPEEWVEKDTFPCKTVGDYRIWTMDAGGKRYARPVGLEFKVGRMERDGTITELTNTNINMTAWGIRENYPSTFTQLSGGELTALAKALTR